MPINVKKTPNWSRLATLTPGRPERHRLHLLWATHTGMLACAHQTHEDRKRASSRHLATTGRRMLGCRLNPARPVLTN